MPTYYFPIGDQDDELVASTAGDMLIINGTQVLPGEPGNRFDFNSTFRRFKKVYRRCVGVRPSNKMKKEFARAKHIWKGDEHLLFEILVPKQWREKTIRCPKCGIRDYFHAERENRTTLVEVCQTWISVAHHRTYGCQHCAFYFHPLAHTAYRHTRIDLRKWMFLIWILDTKPWGYQHFKAADYAEMLDVSVSTVRRMMRRITHGNEMAGKRLLKVYREKGADHPLFDLEVQLITMVLQEHEPRITEEEIKKAMLEMEEGELDLDATDA